jgi:PAS domain S-box-containing protein
MSRTAKNSKSKHVQPIAVVASLPNSAKTPSVSNEEKVKEPIATGAETKPASPAGQVAVLAMGDAGEIIAARDACEAIFGWDPTELVGRNVHVLLKDGLDNEIGRFLHRHRAGMNPAGTIEMHVTALRKDGSEFPAHVTTLTFNWGTTASKNGDGDPSRLCWTAGFRDCSPEGKQAPSPSAQANKSKVGEPVKKTAAHRPTASPNAARRLTGNGNCPSRRCNPFDELRAGQVFGRREGTSVSEHRWVGVRGI